MREQIAELICEMKGEDWEETWRHTHHRTDADAILDLIGEEIEKRLLTEKEITSVRFQARCSRGYGARTDDTIDEVAEKTAQAQLDKILSLLKE